MKRNLLNYNCSTKQVIQVCLELHDPSTKEREVSGLIEASSGLIITENEEGEETIARHGKTYHMMIKPIWKWLRSMVCVSC